MHTQLTRVHAMRLMNWLFVAGGTVITIVGASAEAAPAQQAECKRPARKQFRDGETVVIAQPRTLPCDVQIVDLPIELRADAAGQVANIGTAVLRLIDGRFLTSTGRGELTVWGADGSFVKNVGRLGQGPGEFAASGMSFLQDPKGMVYVRDNNLRWTILSPSLEFVRQLTAVGMGYDPRRSTFLDDGRFLAAPTLGGAALPPRYFQLFDFAQQGDAADTPTGRSGAPAGPGPARVAAFGEPTADDRAIRGVRAERFVAYAGGTTFWAGPPEGAGRGYELELWSTNGTRVRTIRREAPWFPKGADVPAPRLDPNTPVQPPSQITALHADGTGLVYVMVAAKSDRWKPVPPTDREAYRANQENAFDLYFDVIDTEAGVLIASRGPLRYAQALAELPPGFFRGTRQGFRVAETPEGLPVRKIVEVRLVAR